MFENILERLVVYKQLGPAEADNAKLQYTDFQSTVVKYKNAFVLFD